MLSQRILEAYLRVRLNVCAVSPCLFELRSLYAGLLVMLSEGHQARDVVSAIYEDAEGFLWLAAALGAFGLTAGA